ncbi:8-oxo-dGTP pyrophosphatase MutT (NUDIX family) [Allocatelliglobosispora scoriae]|uniref:8-oxo-dGTP pyrophosphatase MutT (NUDIX family) n=1 Tax=Allocatelliglobosispora scoriae TaxID=643052 RepID=A0A841C0T9_9ACTN|nr:NUDIX domain-containing protein [Allocatelliglobosispora scoriae]MBB5873358.1 8-oxo-dGTP pyrophosphatase MutT (NUDIX family) [Allocatelliglobosispora scoriae]
MRLRLGARALILDETDALLLCRLDLTYKGGPYLWLTPGGGIDDGELVLGALRRELLEEIGLHLDADPPLVWTQRVVNPVTAARGYDGAINHIHWVRTPRFTPRGQLSDEQLAREHVTEFRWWSQEELLAYRGDEVFAPRDLPVLLAELLRNGLPAEPVQIGL